jgi:hypothetical protein
LQIRRIGGVRLLLSAARMKWLALFIALVGCTDVKPTDPTTGGAGGKADEPGAGGGRCHEMTGAHHDGDRAGLHGMVLFGRAHYFLEHIPMFQRPHNEQLVMRVSLRDANGAVIERDFGDAGYTVKPTTQFSLDDLTLGKRVTFTGDIHRGSFETGGPVLLRNVKVSVDEVLVARNLPGSEPIASDEQEYFLVGDADDAYVTNMIRDSRGVQHIMRVDAVVGVVPSPSRVHRVRAKSLQRFAPQTQVIASLPKAGAEGTRVMLDVASELWCVHAPDFFERCQ